MSQLDVVTFGEAMVMFVAKATGDLSEVEEFARRAAGAELNVAIGLARLGFRVGWVSRMGKDSLGHFLLKVLAKEGVDSRCVTVDDQYPTGFQLKSKAVGNVDPTVEYFRKNTAASHLGAADFKPEYFLSARHLHVTGVAPALSPTAYELALYAMDQMRAAGKTISFDPNLRPVLWSSREAMVAGLNTLAAKSDWVLPGIQEGLTLTGSGEPDAIADFYLERGARLVVVKLGENGAFVKHREGRAFIPAVPVPKVVDTVGAGDGFAVGLISALLEGCAAEDAAARGNRIAALVIQEIGDSEGLPTRERLDSLMDVIPRPAEGLAG
ncbi:MAG: sugar kinase [Verrucomicrobia bacterium]|nr:sugar kinase [Verrucomicrobiota bacterium]